MTRLLSLAHLTTLRTRPEDLVALAAEAGYDCVGLRLLPSSQGGIAHDLARDPAALRATRAQLAASGLQVFDIEIVRIDADFRAADYEGFLAAGAALGAKAVLVAGDDPDEARLADNLAAFCAQAQPHGLACNLEFMPFTPVSDARIALRVVEASGAANARVLVDALHVLRSTTRLADLSALPARVVQYAQVCDAPLDPPTTVEGLIHAARSERLLPGEGAIDIAALLAALPADIPLSVEIPNETRCASLGAAGWAKACFDATRRAAGI